MSTPASLIAEPDPAIADLVSDSVITLDGAGIIIGWNPAAELLFGWPAQTVCGRPLLHLSPSPGEEGRIWSQLLQEGRWQGRICRRTREGQDVCIEVRRHVRYRTDGEIVDIVELARLADEVVAAVREGGPTPDRLMAASWEIDIASARAVLAKLHGTCGTARDDLLQEAVRRARIVEVNERTARLVGGNRGPAVLAGQSVAAFWPLGSRAVLGELIVEALDAPPGRCVSRRIPSDGILREPQISVWRSNPREQDRLYIAVNGAADDDRSYLYLRASEARYRKLVQYMPVALWQVDASHMARIYGRLQAEGVIDFERYLEEHPDLVAYAGATVPVTDVNQAAIELMGASGAHDLNRPAGYLFAESPRTLRRVMIGRFSAARSHSEVMKLRTFDGRLRDVRFSVTYPEQMYELDTTIFSLEDVTDRLRMEAELRQLQADFSHAARISVLGELASSIAHEVNQPLAAIMTNAQASQRWLAREEPDLAKVRQLTGRIEESARRADEIVRRIRGMAARQLPDHVLLPLNEVVSESLLFVRHEIEARSIRLVETYGSRVPAVLGDRIQLQQVIVNIVMNAVQAVEAMQDDGREICVVTALDPQGDILVLVRDRGPGIAADHVDRIFDGFYTTKARGMGIGLAICRSIVAAHGGSITAANRPGGGAEFRVVLPLAHQPARPQI